MAFDENLVRSFAQGGNVEIAIVGGGATGVELAGRGREFVQGIFRFSAFFHDSGS
jgi:NADH dehydrogenase FAD-containing subunit